MLSDWSIVWVIVTLLLPFSLVCVISADSVADWGDRARCVMFWCTTALFFPFLFCCRTVHLLLLVPPSLLSELQLAEFAGGGSRTLKTLDWTMRHSFSAGIDASIAGKQSKMIAPGDVAHDICTTMLDVVQVHASPRQFVSA